MRVIYKDSKVQVEKEYPNVDISQPVMGLDKDIQFYYIEESLIPEYDSNFQEVKKIDELIEKSHEEYQHLKVCYRTYDIINKSNDEILKVLNDNLGNYLDTEYIVPLRDKHAREMIVLYQKESLTKDEQTRLDYLLSLNDWMNTNRELRQKREDEFLNTGKFPKLDNWIVKP